MSRRPPTPEHVARELRREAGFGCAECGNPILDYHHIIEWNERQHFDPAHMVALCPNHHRRFGKLPKSRAYEAKRKPFNLARGRISEEVGSKHDWTSVMLGNSLYTNCDVALSYHRVPILSLGQSDGRPVINFYFPKEDFWPEIEIVENQVIVWTEDFWDIKFKTNWLHFKRSDKQFLEIDLRSDVAVVRGRFNLHGVEYSFLPSGISLGTNHFAQLGATNCKEGLALNGSARVLRPNYAQSTPHAMKLPPFKDHW